MTASAVVPFSDFAERFGIEPQTDPETGRTFFLWDDMFQLSNSGLPYPNFAVQETAKCFFGKGPDWLRWRYRAASDYPDGYFVLDNVILLPKRTKKDLRYYTLADIERMAHALAINGAIDGEMLSNILEIVLQVAKLYDVFSNAPSEGQDDL